MGINEVVGCWGDTGRIESAIDESHEHPPTAPTIDTEDSHPASLPRCGVTSVQQTVPGSQNKASPASVYLVSSQSDRVGSNRSAER